MFQEKQIFHRVCLLIILCLLAVLPLACGGGESSEGGEGNPDVIAGADSTSDVFTEGGGDVVEVDVDVDVDLPPVDTDEPPVDVEEPPSDTVEPPSDVVEPPTDTEEPPEDIQEELTDIPAGDPCGAGIGTCEEGASCVEVEDGSLDKICYEDVTIGNPCGPGLGQCVEGSKCTNDPEGDGKLCLVEKGAGETCNGEGETCAAGQVCASGGDVASYELMDSLSWKYGPALDMDYEPGPMAYHEEILYVGNAVAPYVQSFENLALSDVYMKLGDENIVGLSTGPSGLYITRGGLQTLKRMDPDGGTFPVAITPATEFVEGACGAGDDPLIVFEDDGAIAEAGEACIEDCDVAEADDACVGTCLAVQTGLSEPCADCFAAQSVCEAAACMETCAAEDETACTLCKAESGCDAGVAACADGEETTIADFGEAGPFDLGFFTTASGFSLVLVSDPSNQTVKSFIVSADVNTPWVAWKPLNLGASGESFVDPRGIAVGGNRVFVADRGLKAVVVFDVLDAGPVFSHLIGAPDEVTGETTLEGPWDVDYDASQNRLAVSDQDGQRVMVFDADSGEILSTIEVDSVDAENPSMLMDVIWSSEQLVVADKGGKRLMVYDVVYQWTCQQPVGVGEACGMGVAPCSIGLSCMPEYIGGPDNVCMQILVPGAPCGADDTVCEEGYACVTGNASSDYGKTCLPEAVVGQPCGPEIGGCAEGAGCNWDGVEHANRLCFADLADGEVCNTYSVGDCGVGSSCLQSVVGSTAMICKPNVDNGFSCGQGIASCYPWLSCHFSGSVVNKACFPYQKEGDVCGISVGNCEKGTYCNFPDAASTAPVCIKNSDVGESCAMAGYGNCDEDIAQCIAMSAGGLNNMCLAKETGPNQVCGAYGLAPCEEGTHCIIDAAPPNNTSASCYSDKGGQGDPCGAAYGVCDDEAGLGCLIDDPAALAGTCQPAQPDFASCGPSTGNVGTCSLLTEACICNDPFISFDLCPLTDFICVPQVGLYETCAVSSVITDPIQGWVGLCPSNTLCSVKEGNGLYYTFMCKLLANSGEACGLLHACATGTTCVCNGVTCSTTELISGDVGICTVGG